MHTILEFMGGDHKACDDLFAAAETAVADKNWDSARSLFERFEAAMAHHLAMEEEVLFPAFEARTGMSMGPTQVMRMEHVQMRELFQAMADAVQNQDKDEFLGQAETLLVMMQQHNMKEEQILYRMADQMLAGELEDVLQRMRAAVA